MATCVTCSTVFPDSLAACPTCRTPAPDATLEDSEATQLASAPSSRGTTPHTHATSSSGWLSSSGAIDHGRFPPGTLLGGRYRIVGRLGRGSMGEVYRADDLKLGQPVALKFLPPDVDRDPARLTQLHTEVRMARQVSHPNVCRVYDIDEVDGHTFLSMEYVDGEDLASVLRRFGRFSVDRALDVSRQICAGLAAAHERGVVHRDFKPANVMLDGSGKVRITDFGLAGAAGETSRAGTPAYMAPEQLAGEGVDARSDIYALGLVLYELFTGQRAIEAKSLAELVRRREEAGIQPPSQIVRDLDPAIDRAILRCLERKPSDRPSSALAVSAALPGGDPLAAALAAGETPSPEMVAAAGESEALGAIPGAAALAVVVFGLIAMAALADRVSVTSIVPFEKPPEVLTDRAAQLTRQFGYADPPADTAQGFSTAGDYLRYVSQHTDTVTREQLRSGRPPIVLYWYRRSPRELVPTGENVNVTFADPPLTISGMVSIILDPEGRLMEFAAVPPQVETQEPAPTVELDWKTLFAAADLNPSDFSGVAPAWTPRTHSDRRAAWEGPMPGWPGVKLRLEAASYRGRLVFFEMVGPWTRPTRMQTAPTTTRQRFSQAIAAIAALLVLGAALLVARHNLRNGRGDRRGAARLAAIVFVADFGAWIVGATHVADVSTELNRFFGGMGNPLWSAAALWVLYIALEPYVRRFWPSKVISWTRLLAGRWRDPLVGRDILIGCLFAVVIALIGPLYISMLPRLGYGPLPDVPRLSDLMGLRSIVATVGRATFSTAFNALWAVFGLVFLRIIFRKAWASAAAAIVFFTLTSSSGMFDVGPAWVGLVLAVVIISAIVSLILFFGLLATLTFFFFNFVVANAVLTLDPSRWFFASSCWMLALGALMACYGFYASRGGEPLFGGRLLD